MTLSPEWRATVDALLEHRDTTREPVAGVRYVAVAAGNEPAIALCICHAEEGTLIFDLMLEDVSVREAHAVMLRYGIETIQETRDIGEGPLVNAVAGALDVARRGFLLS